MKGKSKSLLAISAGVAAFLLLGIASGSVIVGNINSFDVSPSLPHVRLEASEQNYVFSDINAYHSVDNATASVQSSTDVNIPSFAVISDNSSTTVTVTMTLTSFSGASDIKNATVFATLENGSQITLLKVKSISGNLDVTYSGNVSLNGEQNLSVGENITFVSANSYSFSMRMGVFLSFGDVASNIVMTEYYLSTTTDTATYY